MALMITTTYAFDAAHVGYLTLALAPRVYFTTTRSTTDTIPRRSDVCFGFQWISKSTAVGSCQRWRVSVEWFVFLFEPFSLRSPSFIFTACYAMLCDSCRLLRVRGLSWLYEIGFRHVPSFTADFLLRRATLSVPLCLRSGYRMRVSITREVALLT